MQTLTKRSVKVYGITFASLLSAAFMGGTAAAQITVARLRADYNAAASGTFTNNQLASFADGAGSGTWSYYGTAGTGFFLTGGTAHTDSQLVYSTAAVSSRLANTFGLPSPWWLGVANSQLHSGTYNGAPPHADELGVHPWDDGALKYLVLRWTAGSNVNGPISIAGGVRKLNNTTITGNPDGINLTIYVAGVSRYSIHIGPADTTGSTFNLSGLALTPGQVVDFVIDPNSGNINSDLSAISATIQAAGATIRGGPVILLR